MNSTFNNQNVVSESKTQECALDQKTCAENNSNVNTIEFKSKTFETSRNSDSCDETVVVDKKYSENSVNNFDFDYLIYCKKNLPKILEKLKDPSSLVKMFESIMFQQLTNAFMRHTTLPESYSLIQMFEVREQQWKSRFEMLNKKIHETHIKIHRLKMQSKFRPLERSIVHCRSVGLQVNISSDKVNKLSKTNNHGPLKSSVLMTSDNKTLINQEKEQFSQSEIIVFNKLLIQAPTKRKNISSNITNFKVKIISVTSENVNFIKENKKSSPIQSRNELILEIPDSEFNTTKRVVEVPIISNIKFSGSALKISNQNQKSIGSEISTLMIPEASNGTTIKIINTFNGNVQVENVLDNENQSIAKTHHHNNQTSKNVTNQNSLPGAVRQYKNKSIAQSRPNSYSQSINDISYLKPVSVPLPIPNINVPLGIKRSPYSKSQSTMDISALKPVPMPLPIPDINILHLVERNMHPKISELSSIVPNTAIPAPDLSVTLNTSIKSNLIGIKLTWKFAPDYSVDTLIGYEIFYFELFKTVSKNLNNGWKLFYKIKNRKMSCDFLIDYEKDRTKLFAVRAIYENNHRGPFSVPKYIGE